MRLSTRLRLLSVLYVGLATAVAQFDGWTLLQLENLTWLQSVVEAAKWALPVVTADLFALNAATQKANPAVPVISK